MDVNFVVFSPSDPENKITLGLTNGFFYISTSQGRQQHTVKLSLSEMMDIADAAGMLIEHSAQETLEIKPPLDYEINNELQEFDIEQEFDELELEPRSLRASKVRRAKTLAEAVADGSLTPRDGAL